MTDPVGTLPADMSAWIEEATGTRIVSATRQAGGGRNQAWIVELERPEGIERVFLRWDRSDPAATGDPWTLRREAEVYRALTGTALLAAQFIAVHPTAQAMLLTVVEGNGRYSSITDPEQATAVAQDFIRRLAELHRLDVTELGLAGAGASIADHVRAQLDEMDAVITFRGGVPHAELGLALAWLRANVPAYDGRPVLVQGDTGPGNFMFDGDHISAIVDWELAHVGDPMDDLAWVSLRAVQEPLPDLEERFAEYERASGNAVDLERIRYYRILAEAKIMVMSHRGDSSPASDDAEAAGDPGGGLIFGQLHRRLLVEMLSEALGLSLDAATAAVPDAPAGIEPSDAEPAQWHGLYGVVLDQLRTVVAPRVDDGFAQQRLKGLARAIKYLQAVDLHGRTFAEQELADLTSVLGSRPSSTGSGRVQLAEAIRDAKVTPEAALAVIHRRVQRDDVLLASASGVFAHRHFDPLLRFAVSPSAESTPR